VAAWSLLTDGDFLLRPRGLNCYTPTRLNRARAAVTLLWCQRGPPDGTYQLCSMVIRSSDLLGCNGFGATAAIPSRHIVGRIRNPLPLQKPTCSRPALLNYPATNSMTLPPAFWRIRTSPGHRAGTPPHGAHGAISTAVTGASRHSSGTGHRVRADDYWRSSITRPGSDRWCCSISRS